MSFGGMKAARYVFFALPFLFAMWGLAVGAIFPAFMRWAETTWEKVFDVVTGSKVRPLRIGYDRLSRYGFVCVGFVVIGFAVFSQSAFREGAQTVIAGTVKVLTRPGQLFVGPVSEPWASHRDELSNMVKRASVFIASLPSTTMLELGPYAAILNRNALDESPGEHEFAHDSRVGRPIISTVASLESIMNCYPSGVVVVPSDFWRVAAGVGEDVSNFLMSSARLTRLKTPGAPFDLMVFEWQGNPDGTSSRCEKVRSMLARKSQRL
jgi:hypothetical protein